MSRLPMKGSSMQGVYTLHSEIEIIFLFCYDLREDNSCYKRVENHSDGAGIITEGDKKLQNNQ